MNKFNISCKVTPIQLGLPAEKTISPSYYFSSFTFPLWFVTCLLSATLLFPLLKWTRFVEMCVQVGLNGVSAGRTFSSRHWAELGRRLISHGGICFSANVFSNLSGSIFSSSFPTIKTGIYIVMKTEMVVFFCFLFEFYIRMYVVRVQVEVYRYSFFCVWIFHVSGSLWWKMPTFINCYISECVQDVLIDSNVRI